MEQAFQELLIGHVIWGVLGVGVFYVTWMGLYKKDIKINFLKYATLVGLISFIASWIEGGYYYVAYYGSAVKPAIKAGDYPWAHSVFMEIKEHIFLFLPFLAATILLSLWCLGDEVKQNKKLRNAVASLAGLTFIIGVLIILGGMVVSGAAK